MRPLTRQLNEQLDIHLHVRSRLLGRMGHRAGARPREGPPRKRGMDGTASVGPSWKRMSVSMSISRLAGKIAVRCPRNFYRWDVGGGKPRCGSNRPSSA